MNTLTTLADHGIRLGFDVLAAIAILIIGWLLGRWAAALTRRLAERSGRLDRTVTNLLARLARWTVLAFTVIAVLGRFGVQTASLVALLGAAGLAVGLALQGALSNVAAGVMLIALRPFSVGDAIDVGGTMGTVDDINLFATRLTSFDGVPVHVPNSNIWGKDIKNFSQADQRRNDLVVGIGYDDDIGAAMDVLRGLLDADSRVLAEPAPMIAVDSLGDSSVNLLMRYWTAAGDFYATKVDLTRAVKERFDASNISIPFPQRDLHLVEGGLPAAQGA
ncbi:MAG TPA: mechanosensitive ion channel domain-containing protein [Trueperaceae bacterium]|nr:mechanosensitive ion channel domain-containing protein [Trueperaceae bacterium]